MNPSMILYRIGNWFHRHRMRRIGWMISWINRLVFGGFIPSSATIGKSVTVGYWGLGVVFHKDCVIGNGCKIGQNVTIGRNPGKPGVPRIGRQVYVAAGVVISGDIRVGDFAVIGANSVVLSDVPDQTFVAGSPARVIRAMSDQEIADIHGK